MSYQNVVDELIVFLEFILYLPRQIYIYQFQLKQNLKVQENPETLQRLVTPRQILGQGYKSYSNERVKIASYDHEHNITLPYLLDAKVIDDSECVARTGKEVHKTQLCSKIQDNGYGSTRLCEV